MHAPPDSPSSPTLTFRRLDAEWLTTRPYTSHFCEENAWWLAADVALAALRRTVVVISNPHKTVAMWQQRAAQHDPIVWDYHVVVVVEAVDDDGSIGGAVVLDHDCLAGTALPVGEWLAASFPVEVAPQYEPQFRLIDGSVYVDRFSSDRSHMLDDKGQPLQPFPPWTTIGTGHALPAMIDFGDDSFGAVVDIDGLAERFGLFGE